MTEKSRAGKSRADKSTQVLREIIEPALPPDFKTEHFLDPHGNDDNIVAGINRYLQEAELCVADLSGSSPNVLYECGIREGLGRPIIRIASNAKDVPFDLKTIQYITYDLKDRAPAVEKIRQRVAQMTRDGLFDPPAKITPSLKRDIQTDFICKYIEDHHPRSIDVLQTSLIALGDKFFGRLRESSDVMVRILLNHPEYAAGFSLGESHAKDVARVNDQIEAMEKELKYHSHGPTVGLWHYNHQPSIALLMIDDALLQLGWYLVAPRGKDLPLRILGNLAPGLIVEGAHVRTLHGSFKQHFERVLAAADMVRTTGPNARQMKADWLSLQNGSARGAHA